MLSKKKRPYDASSLPPEAKLQRNVRDLFGSNALPAQRIQSLVNDIADVSVPSFQGLKRTLGTNICRNLRRTFLKNCQWPKLYWAEVRVQCLRTSREVKQWCAFCLPHEYIHVLARLGDKEKVLDDSALDPLSKAHLEKCQALAGEKLLALGLWGDGVPCNWDRTESVETFTLNLPGNGEYKLLRLPLTAVSRKQPHRCPRTRFTTCRKSSLGACSVAPPASFHASATTALRFCPSRTGPGRDRQARAWVYGLRWSRCGATGSSSKSAFISLGGTPRRAAAGSARAHRRRRDFLLGLWVSAFGSLTLSVLASALALCASVSEGAGLRLSSYLEVAEVEPLGTGREDSRERPSRASPSAGAVGG